MYVRIFILLGYEMHASIDLLTAESVSFNSGVYVYVYIQKLEVRLRYTARTYLPDNLGTTSSAS